MLATYLNILKSFKFAQRLKMSIMNQKTVRESTSRMFVQSELCDFNLIFHQESLHEKIN